MSNAASHRSLFCVPVLAMFACSSIGCTPDATDLGAGDNLEMSQHALFSALSVPYRGVNLASAEFGPQDPTDFNSGVLPGVYGSNYVYPDGDTEATYFMSKGMNTFRLPFRWERIQRSLSGALDSAELGRLTTVVNAITGKGGYVILDLHNYGRYGNNNNVIGSSAVPNTAFADIWYKLASQFVNNPKVIFEIMNEPYGMISTEAWVVSANAAITAIRNTGAKQLILVQGYHWSGAHAWSSSDVYGTSNAVAMLNIVDPGNNYAYDVHQYLDQSSDITKNFAGLSDQCTSKTIGSQSLKNFTDWLVANQRRGFLTEFAGGRNSTCYAAIKDTVAHMMNNPTVYLGWTYWAAGPR